MDDAKIPEGVWPVMLTPFGEKGRIDWPGYESLIEFYLEHGVVGLFANCGSSEAMHLSVEEMLALIERAVARAAGRVPVVAGALVKREPNALASFIRDIRDLGVDAVVLAPSLLAEADESDDVLKRRLEAALDMTDDIPLGVYEWPLPYHRLLSPETLEWIAHTGRFVFHKDTCCDIDSISEKLRRVRGTPLKFFNANLPTLVDSLVLGADGYCGIGGNLYPQAYVWLCAHAKTRLPLARRLQSLLMSVEGRLCVKYAMTAKTALAMRGVKIQPCCRQRRDRLGPTDFEALRKAWSEFESGFEGIKAAAASDCETSPLPPEDGRRAT